MYIWVVATQSEGSRQEGNEKHFSWAMRLSNGSELKSQLKCVDHAHLVATKKEAYILAELWNNAYKENGTYMY